MTVTELLDKVRFLLTGEPLRAIGYGAIAVVYLVSRALVLTGTWASAPTLDVIVLAVGTAVTAVTEFARRYTFSQNTVTAIVTELDPTAPIPQPPDGAPVV